LNDISKPDSDSPEDDGFPTKGVLLGIDYGTKRIGIAVATYDHSFASPLEIYYRQNAEVDARYFKKMTEEYRIKGIVIGLPIHLSGEESAMSRQAREFGKWLHELVKLPIRYSDERFTSSVAEDLMIGIDMTRKQRKKRLDMAAAQIILQSYLDHHRPRPIEGDDDNADGETDNEDGKYKFDDSNSDE